MTVNKKAQAFQISLLIKMQTKSITKPHQLIARTVQNDRTRVRRQATIDQISFEKPKHAINTRFYWHRSGVI